MEEMPDVFAMIGPVAPARNDGVYRNHSHDEWHGFVRLNVLRKIGLAWPEARFSVHCVSLQKQLELFEENEYDVNAFLIKALVQLQATEMAPLIERAFAATALRSLS